MRRTLFCLLSSLAIAVLGAACSPAPSADAPPGSTSTTPDAPAGTTSPGATTPAPAETGPTGSTTTPPPGGSTTIVVGTDACSSDDDCVPSTCCNPTACVASARAPDCSTVRCGRDCSKPTTICGGGCLCQAGKCAARLGTQP